MTEEEIQKMNERFWSKVEIKGTGNDKCWNWKGCLNKDGYGQFLVKGKSLKAPRIAFFLRNRFWPICALHHCDNPSCVNPSHLYNGTQKENARDRELRGRSNPVRGEDHPNYLLSENEVRALRHEYATTSISIENLAKKFGRGTTTVQKCVKRQTWKHIK